MLTMAGIAHARDVTLHNSNFHLTVHQGNEPDQKVRTILNWFTSINFRSIQTDTFARHSPGTGAWFIESDKYQEWLSGDSRVLWPKGSTAGAGKTILSSIIINDLHERCSSRPHTAVIFAYCRYSDRHSVTDILASFVKQLAQGHPRLLAVIEPVYDVHQTQETQMGERELQGLLHTMLDSFQKTYLVIDALDEAPDDTRLNLFKALLLLRGFRASLLFASRPLQLLEPLFPDATFVHMEYENRGAIELFIDQHIEEEPRLRALLRGKQPVREEMCAKLKQKSEGMFLVAALQIESLKRSLSVKELRNAVDMLPSGLDGLYERTWERVEALPEPEAALAMKAIVWLAYAHRSLTVAELQHALAISSEEESFDEECVVVEELIVSACCGLIVVDGESRIVRLVHNTTYDFFRSKRSGLFAKPHTFIATCCLAYLSAFDFVGQNLCDRLNLLSFLRTRPLLDYTYHHWAMHAQECSGEGGLPTAAFTFFAQCDQYPHLDSGDYGEFDFFKRGHMAARYGLLDLLPATNEWCNEVTSHYKYTPLMLASSQNRTAAVEFILSQPDVDANMQDLYGHSALIRASYRGHEAVVGLLLARAGVAVNAQDWEGQTALIAACSRGHEGVSRLLLSQNDVVVNVQDGHGWTALIAASHRGHEAVVRLLLSRSDVAVNMQDRKGWTALIRACYWGREAVVGLLLSRPDVAVNMQDAKGWTALITASHYGYEAVVRLLLSRTDIAIDLRDKFGHTALIRASYRSHEAIVGMLLSHTEPITT